MHQKLKEAFHRELKSGKELFFLSRFEESFSHLERAHILGQMDVMAHTISHYWMLRIAIRTKSWKDACGQIIRIPAGIVGSAVGIVPTGNTGGSNVSATKSMDIPKDLQEFLKYGDTMSTKIEKNSKIFLRLALAASFLSAVADRFGIWGKAGSPGVAWGNMESFLGYTAMLNPWAPEFLSNSLGYVATGLEVVLGVFLIIGFRLKESSLISFVLLLIFALSMTFTGGVKGPLDYSVFTASAASLLLFSSCKKEV